MKHFILLLISLITLVMPSIAYAEASVELEADIVHLLTLKGEPYETARAEMVTKWGARLAELDEARVKLRPIFAAVAEGIAASIQMPGEYEETFSTFVRAMETCANPVPGGMPFYYSSMYSHFAPISFGSTNYFKQVERNFERYKHEAMRNYEYAQAVVDNDATEACMRELFVTGLRCAVKDEALTKRLEKYHCIDSTNAHFVYLAHHIYWKKEYQDAELVLDFVKATNALQSEFFCEYEMRAIAVRGIHELFPYLYPKCVKWVETGKHPPVTDNRRIDPDKTIIEWVDANPEKAEEYRALVASWKPIIKLAHEIPDTHVPQPTPQTTSPAATGTPQPASAKQPMQWNYYLAGGGIICLIVIAFVILRRRRGR